MAFSLSVLANGTAATRLRLSSSAVVARQRLLGSMELATRAVERDLGLHGLKGNKGRHAFWGVTGARGNRLGRRSGKTAGSVTARVFSRGDQILGVVGSPRQSLAKHERGGTISGNPYLRIPTRNAQTGSGIDRWVGVSARDIPNTYIFRSRAGKLWIAQNAVSAARSLLYLLVRNVQVRPRRVFATTTRRMRSAVVALMNGAGGRIAIDLGGSGRG